MATIGTTNISLRAVAGTFFLPTGSNISLKNTSVAGSAYISGTQLAFAPYAMSEFTGLIVTTTTEPPYRYYMAVRYSLADCSTSGTYDVKSYYSSPLTTGKYYKTIPEDPNYIYYIVATSTPSIEPTILINNTQYFDSCYLAGGSTTTTTTTTTSTTLPPFFVTFSNKQCTSTGGSVTTNFSGGTGAYTYTAIGNTVQEVTDKLDGTISGRIALSPGATSYTYTSLTNGTYYIGVRDSLPHNEISSVSIFCTYSYVLNTNAKITGPLACTEYSNNIRSTYYSYQGTLSNSMMLYSVSGSGGLSTPISSGFYSNGTDELYVYNNNTSTPTIYSGRCGQTHYYLLTSCTPSQGNIYTSIVPDITSQQYINASTGIYYVWDNNEGTTTTQTVTSVQKVSGQSGCPATTTTTTTSTTLPPITATVTQGCNSDTGTITITNIAGGDGAGYKAGYSVNSGAPSTYATTDVIGNSITFSSVPNNTGVEKYIVYIYDPSTGIGTGITTLSTINCAYAYAISPSVTSVSENNSVTWTITTTNVPNGTVLYWTNGGTTTAADFNENVNSGNVTINNNTASITLTPKIDLINDINETIIIQLRTGSVSGTIVKTSATVTVTNVISDISFVSVSTSCVTYAGSGKISIQIQGGSGAYKYSNDSGSTWVPATATSSQSWNFSSLANGSYHIKALDTGNANKIFSYASNPVTVSCLTALSLNANLTCNTTTGLVTATLTATNGNVNVRNYYYKKTSDTTWISSGVSTIGGLLASTEYDFKVTDDIGEAIQTNKSLACVATTTTTTTTTAPITFDISSGCSGGAGTGTISINNFSGGNGTYTKVGFGTSANPTPDITLPDGATSYNKGSFANGTWYVTLQDSSGKVGTNSVSVYCITTTTTVAPTTSTTTTVAPVTTTTAAPTTTTCTPADTYLSSGCSGYKRYDTYADGVCGTYNGTPYYSIGDCGYSLPILSYTTGTTASPGECYVSMTATGGTNSYTYSWSINNGTTWTNGSSFTYSCGTSAKIKVTDNGSGATDEKTITIGG